MTMAKNLKSCFSMTHLKYTLDMIHAPQPNSISSKEILLQAIDVCTLYVSATKSQLLTDSR